MKRLAKSAINIAAWILGITFLVLFWRNLISSSGDSWNTMIATLDWNRFLLALLICIFGQGLRALLGYLSQRELNYPFSMPEAYRAWFISQLGKYIPGGVWLFATRVVFYRRSGMPMVLASSVMAWEVLSIVGTGLLLGITSIVVIDNPDWAMAIGGGSLVLIIALLISLMTWPWRLLARLKFPKTDKWLQTMTGLGSSRFRLMAQLSLLSLVSWLIIGVGFYVLLDALVPTHDLPLWYAIVTYAVAWTVGFLVLFAPAGLGPREAVITLLLTPYYGVSVAFTLALLARLWWTLAEGIHILIAAASQVNVRLTRQKQA